MTTALLELAPVLFELSAYGIGALGLSLLGTYVERFALATLQHGQPALAVWAAVMGAVALYFAYSITTDRVVPALFALVGRSAASPE